MQMANSCVLYSIRVVLLSIAPPSDPSLPPDYPDRRLPRRKRTACIASIVNRVILRTPFFVIAAVAALITHYVSFPKHRHVFSLPLLPHFDVEGSRGIRERFPGRPWLSYTYA